MFHYSVPVVIRSKFLTKQKNYNLEHIVILGLVLYFLYGIVKFFGLLFLELTCVSILNMSKHKTLNYQKK